MVSSFFLQFSSKLCRKNDVTKRGNVVLTGKNRRYIEEGE